VHTTAVWRWGVATLITQTTTMTHTHRAALALLCASLHLSAMAQYPGQVSTFGTAAGSWVRWAPARAATLFRDSMTLEALDHLRRRSEVRGMRWARSATGAALYFECDCPTDVDHTLFIIITEQGTGALHEQAPPAPTVSALTASEMLAAQPSRMSRRVLLTFASLSCNAHPCTL
jgi:hypothetical protein